MIILKKVQQFKDYSKALFTKSNKISDTPKAMINYILSRSAATSNEHLLAQLAELTNGSSFTTEIANILISKLECFQYTEAAIGRTFLALQCIVYILKNGNSKFSIDISGNQIKLEELQAVNSRFFENEFSKKSKKLNYNLEMIRQKSKYIKKLLNDPSILAQQRYQAQQHRKSQMIGRMQHELQPKQCETNINLKKELSLEPVYVSSRQQKKRISETVENSERITHNFKESHAKNMILAFGSA